MHARARSPSPSAYADLKRGLLAVDFVREREDEPRGAGVDRAYERGGGAVVGLERAHVQRIVGLMLGESLHFGARVEPLDLDEPELLAAGRRDLTRRLLLNGHLAHREPPRPRSQLPASAPRRSLLGTLHARLTLWHRFAHTPEHHLQHREGRCTRTRRSERCGSGGWPSARGMGSSSQLPTSRSLKHAYSAVFGASPRGASIGDRAWLALGVVPPGWPSPPGAACRRLPRRRLSGRELGDRPELRVHPRLRRQPSALCARSQGRGGPGRGAAAPGARPVPHPQRPRPRRDALFFTRAHMCEPLRPGPARLLDRPRPDAIHRGAGGGATHPRRDRSFNRGRVPRGPDRRPRSRGRCRWRDDRAWRRGPSSTPSRGERPYARRPLGVRGARWDRAVRGPLVQRLRAVHRERVAGRLAERAEPFPRVWRSPVAPWPWRGWKRAGPGRGCDGGLLT